MSFDKPVLWGGVECTVNRVGDRYMQQLPQNGHLERVADIDTFAALGLRGLRVPVLWEIAERVPGSFDLTSFEPMLERVRTLGVRAIAGLVHHGSGPRWTSLVDAEFEHGLARYAAHVARRHPWILDYTPVNEPLTTARFSGLYGHWFPHGRDETCFVRALLNETRATIRAMQAIRDVQPAARLVQTEDIAHVTSTELLRGESEFQNHRRWLSLDLLCGRVDREHPLYAFLLRSGADDAELAWLRDHACPPDIIGMNYYFTSDRHLDESLDNYPAWSAVPHPEHPHADVHSSAFGPGLVGHAAVLDAIWNRYQLPIAITEVHAGSTREEQLRWLKEAWEAACAACEAGVRVEAVTAWALLGSFDWNKLVVEERGFYEPGVFDVRGPHPRPTALAHMLRDLADTGEHDHPVLDCYGWWRRRGTSGQSPSVGFAPVQCRARPILITGGGGTLAKALSAACDVRGLAYEIVDRSRLDIGSRSEVADALRSLQPWAVVNAAGFMRVDEAEQEPDRCLRANTDGPAVLAAECQVLSLRLLTFSSDLVFDGRQREPYLETAAVSPLSVYGRSKAEGERRVLRALPDALVVRTSALFGPADDANFVALVLHSLREGRRFRAPEGIVSPTYVPHLIDACLDLLIDGERGIWHLANRGEVPWSELAARAAVSAGLPAELITEHADGDYAQRAPRPAYSVLGSERGKLMPTLEEGLEHYFHARALALSA